MLWGKGSHHSFIVSPAHSGAWLRQLCSVCQWEPLGGISGDGCLKAGQLLFIRDSWKRSTCSRVTSLPRQTCMALSSAVVSGGGGSSLLSFFFAVPNHGAMQNNKNQGRKSNFWPTMAELIEEEKTLLGKRSLAVHGCCEHNSSWAPGVSPFLPRTSFPFCRCWQRGTAAIFTRLSCAFYVEFWMMACSLHWKFS